MGIDAVAKLEQFVLKPLAFRCKPPVHNPALAKYPEIMKRLGVLPAQDARYTVSVVHKLRGPASPDDLQLLRTMLGTCAEPFAQFYARHDGFVLYKDPKSEAAGVEAIDIRRWQDATEYMRQMNDGCPPEDDPAQVLSGVAFAHAPGSGNFFVVPVTGASAGQIFYANHDGWYSEPFARSFDQFIDRITSDPIKLLSKDLGCHARYSDGAGCEQWIPEEVVEL